MSSMTGYGGMSNATGSSMKRGGRPGDVIPKGYRGGQLQQFSPEQMRLFQSLFSHVGPDSFLSKLGMGDEETFNQMEAPALRQFSGLQGNIASRFSGMGMGARKSSGFQNTMNQAASDFAQDLASKRADLQRQAILDLMGISNSLLGQRPQEKFLFEKQKKSSGGFGGAIGAGLGGLGGFLAGGPAGGLAGAKLGFGVGSAF